MKTKMLSIVVILILLAGCSVNMQAIKKDIENRIDPISITDRDKFQADLEECATFAAAEQNRAQKEMLAKTIVGAMTGAVLGYGLGGMYDQQTANRSAGFGVVAGASGGVAASGNNLNAIVGNCMVHRGYLILW